MRKYEIMAILDPEVDDRQVSSVIEKHTKVITDEGGVIDNVDIWGRRHLAYEIQKKSEGIYVVIDVTCEPHSVQEVDRLMSIDESIMRQKVIRPDK